MELSRRTALVGAAFGMASLPLLGATAAATQPDAKKRATLILSPHQDDETIRLGGYIAFSFDRGDDLSLVCVTDGAATNVAKKLGLSKSQTARWRNREQATAWDWLTDGKGAPPTNLGFPDGGAKVNQIVESTMDILRGMSGQPEVYVATFPPERKHAYIPYPKSGDAHVDHIACVRAGEILSGRGVIVRYARHPKKSHISGSSTYEMTTDHQMHRMRAAVDAYRTIGYRSVPDQLRAAVDTRGKSVIVR